MRWKKEKWLGTLKKYIESSFKCFINQLMMKNKRKIKEGNLKCA